MKIHLWRFVHDCLPSGVQLVRRHVPADGSCIFCGKEENIEHVLLFCQFARATWREIKQRVPMHLNRKNFATCKQWLFEFLGRASAIQATTLVVGFWHIWEARNESRNENVKPNPSRTGGKVLAYVDMIKTHLSKPASKQRCEPGSDRWTPPPQGTVLVNSDAAISEATGCMGAGVVIRNHQGDFLVACREHLNQITEPEYAEALALRRAVVLAKEEGFDRVVFASDCLSLVQRLSSSAKDRSNVGIMVADIKVLTQHFSSASFCHVKRNLNEVAHILAKSSLLVDSTCIFYSLPDCIRQTFCNVVS
jgi:ribonuclease HI